MATGAPKDCGKLHPSHNERVAFSHLHTKQRVIEHTEQTLPKDYVSVMSTCITNQLEHPNHKTLQDKVGLRQRLLDAKLKAQVEDEFSKKLADEYAANRKVSYVSDSMANYNKAAFQPSLVVRDPSIRIPTYHADYCTDTPITYFSDCVRRGVNNFPTTFVITGNPFRKSNAFSADIKLEPTIRRTESNERPRPLPTIREFGLLREFRRRLFDHVKSLDFSGIAGRIVRILVDMIWSLASENASALHIEALVSGISASLNFDVTTEERKALLCAYDFNSTNMISLPDFTDFIRGSLSPRAVELVNMVLVMLASAQPVYTEGFVSEVAITDTYKSSAPAGGGAVETLLSSLRVNYGQVSVDDFFEYYTDVYAEMENNQQFEAMLRSTWGI